MEKQEREDRIAVIRAAENAWREAGNETEFIAETPDHDPVKLDDAIVRERRALLAYRTLRNALAVFPE